MSIWKYKEIKQAAGSNISDYYTLEEGNTPLEKIAVDDKPVLIKREDLNPTGSWKDRGTAFKLTKLISDGVKEAVIPSSGNAAISFVQYIQKLELNFSLHIVVSNSISGSKKLKLEELVKNTNHKIYYDSKAKRKSSQISSDLKIPILRSSMDSEILSGYWSLGYELANPILHAKNPVLFVSASSGTALVGLAQGLFSKLEDESKMPRIVVCQTESCFPIVENLHPEDNFEFSEKSLADSIVDKSVLRLPQILKIIRETSGDAIVVENQYIELANKKFSNHNLSYTSLLPVAGFLKLKQQFTNNEIFIIASGK